MCFTSVPSFALLTRSAQFIQISELCRWTICRTRRNSTEVHQHVELACKPNVSNLSSIVLGFHRLMWSELMPKNLLILKERETYYTKGTLNTSMGTFYKRLEACDSINVVDMNKSSASLMSALKTRTTVWLRLCASEKPERTWFLNNANGRYTGITMNEINCIKKDQSLIHATKNRPEKTIGPVHSLKSSLILESLPLNFAGVRRGSREKTFSDSYFACFW